jgi:hypothetical protein
MGGRSMTSARFLLLCSNTKTDLGLQVAVSWRLLGANNRELGRSAGTTGFPDVDSCRAAVRRLVDGLPGATASIVSAGAGAAAWTWRLEIGGRTVAAAGRSYLRNRECRYSLAHFLAAAPQAFALADLQVRVVAGERPGLGTGIGAGASGATAWARIPISASAPTSAAVSVPAASGERVGGAR